MKFFQAIAVFSLLLGSAVAQAETPTINLSIGGEIVPGMYGQVQFGNAPPPAVVYAQPVVVVRQSRKHEEEPIYLHVPPGHAQNWAKHCGEYDACDRPVYFVKSAEYESGYREHRDEGRREEVRREESRRDEGRYEPRRDEGRRDVYRDEGRRTESRSDEGRGRERRREERD